MCLTLLLNRLHRVTVLENSCWDFSLTQEIFGDIGDNDPKTGITSTKRDTVSP